MAYAKPQVTIDLDEYNSLRTKINTDAGAWELAAQTILFTALKVTRGDRAFMDRLRDAGITFQDPSSTSTMDMRPENLKIQFTKSKRS